MRNRIQKCFVITLFLLFGINRLSAVVYYEDQSLHLSFSLYPETREAYVGNNVDKEHTAFAYPPFDDPWWNKMDNLWKDIVVPSTLNVENVEYTVVGVADRAFSRTTNTETIVLPPTVKSIGNKAFYFCVNLLSVNIPEGVTEIGSSAFELCRKIKVIDLPSTITSIGSRAFVDCHELARICIPAACTSIDNEAFVWCKGLKELIIEDGPNTLELGYNYELSLEWEYGDKSGYGSQYFRGLFADCPIETCHIGRPLSYPRSSSKIYPPFKQYVNYNGYQAWSQTTYSIKNLTLGKSLRTIPEELLSYVSVGNSDFTLPDSLTSIGTRAFFYANLKGELTLPANCTSIEDYAFSETTGLYVLNCLSNTPPTIAEHAFYAFHGNNIVAKVPDGAGSSYRDDALWQQITIIDSGDLSLDIRVTTQGSLSSIILTKVDDLKKVYSLKLSGRLGNEDWTAIKQMTNLHTIDLSGITNDAIPSGAFQKMNIFFLKLPEYLKSIGSYAFNECTHLTGELVIPESCRSIGERAFRNTSVRSVILPENIQIGEYSFSSTNIESLHLKGNGTVLNRSAFYDCQCLSHITMEEGVISIGNNCFSSCKELQTVQLSEGLKSIGESAFNKCNNLREINFPSTLETCGSYCFSYCTSLESVEIPGSLSVLPYSMFSYCENLRSVILHEGILEFKENVFIDCDKIKSVMLPNTAKIIGNNAFACDSIVEIDIPKSVQSYSVNAWTYKVKTFHVHWDTPINMNTTNYYQGTTCYVPIGTSSKYLSDSYFKVFTIKEEGELSLNVGQGGSCMIGTDSIGTGTINRYFLPGKSLSLKAVPDVGNKVLALLVNGHNVVTELSSDGSYLLAEPMTNLNISVVFGPDNYSEPSTCELHIPDSTIRYYQPQVDVPLYLDNSASVCGFEFWLELPEGISIDGNSEDGWGVVKGNRMEAGHNLYCVQEENGYYHLLCFDLSSNTEFSDLPEKKDLPLAILSLNIDNKKWVGSHTLALHDIILNHNNGDTITEYRIDYYTTEIVFLNKCRVQVSTNDTTRGSVSVEGYSYNPDTGDADANDWLIYKAKASANCHFTGWQVNGKTVSTDNPMIVETLTDICYTAIFEPDTHVIFFYDYDNTLLESQTLEWNANVTTPESPERKDYKFVGWTPEVPAQMPDHNVMCKALYILPGDVNGNDERNLTDLTTLVNIILSDSVRNNDIMLAADVNEDGKLDIADLTIIVNLIMGQAWHSSGSYQVASFDNFNAQCTLSRTGMANISLSLENNLLNLSGLQFDIILPDCVTLDSITTNCSKHSISSKKINDSITRIILYSFDNDLFYEKDEKLVNLNVSFVKSVDNFDFSLSNIVMVNPDADSFEILRESINITLNDPTSVSHSLVDEDQVIYNLNGLQQHKATNGVVIINGKKILQK